VKCGKNEFSGNFFDKNARKDEKSGELFMGEEEFINAIAPEGEDYVRYIPRPLFSTLF
jgi:solute carrier family 25 aspartate/glutamate transporter 12/13